MLFGSNRNPPEVDPASYEHFIETLRQGSAGALRVAASARLLQREAHKTSTFAKAAMGTIPEIYGEYMVNI